MEHDAGFVWCQCSACLERGAQSHRDADAACGRAWVCNCGMCRTVRGSAEIADLNARFERLEALEKELVRIRSIKEALLADDGAEAAPADPCRCGHALLSHDAVGASRVSSPSGYVGACVHCSCKAFTRRRRAKEAGGG